MKTVIIVTLLVLLSMTCARPGGNEDKKSEEFGFTGTDICDWERTCRVGRRTCRTNADYLNPFHEGLSGKKTRPTKPDPVWNPTLRTCGEGHPIPKCCPSAYCDKKTNKCESTYPLTELKDYKGLFDDT